MILCGSRVWSFSSLITASALNLLCIFRICIFLIIFFLLYSFFQCYFNQKRWWIHISSLLFFGGDSAFKWKGQINWEVVHTLPDWAFLPSANFCKSKHGNPFLSNFQVQFQLWIGKVPFFANRYQTSMPMDLFLSFSYQCWIGPFLVLQGSQSKHRKWSIPPFKHFHFLSYFNFIFNA